MGELDAYLRESDRPQWERLSSDRLRLRSQTWREQEWYHDVTVHGAERGKTCILVLTGGDINDTDELEAMLLSEWARLPVATLYHLPNQPLFADLCEDDLIAFTFIQYLESGETDWPLLLPMVKSAISAMDALTMSFAFEDFVLTGISKRGWTTWLAGATGDPRIRGIAPMSIDHLDMPRQMKHQIQTWGCYSEQIQSYTELELPKQLDSPEGLRLNSIVDPFAYLGRYRCPILIETGTNDPFWQVDALGLYWHALPEQKWTRAIPNAGHVLDKIEKNKTLAAFARMVAQKGEIRTPAFSWQEHPDSIAFRTEANIEVVLWKATSQNYDFREKEWTCDSLARDLRIGRPVEGLVAAFAEFRLLHEHLNYSITTPVQVFGRPRP